MNKKQFTAGIVLTILLCLCTVGSSGNAQDHFFTVGDSIEMTRFARGNPQALFSPNNRYFVIVASRGIIRFDAVESTILLYSCDDVRAFLHGSSGRAAPAPRIVGRLRAVPRETDANSDDSYSPIIWALQWLPDSKKVLFLGLDPLGKRRLYEADVVSKTMRALTPASQDVTQFAYSDGSIVYETTSLNVFHDTAARINADAEDLTGASFSPYLSLFPKTRVEMYSDLWAIRNGKVRRLTNRSNAFRLKVLTGHSVIAPSPNGRSVVVLLPVTSIPPSWSYFEPNPLTPYMRLGSKTSLMTNWQRPTEFTLIDLLDGKATSLVQAPEGNALNSVHRMGAVWSSNGTEVLVMDTFLPLEGADATERMQRRYPCLAAVVDVRSKANACVAFGSYDFDAGKNGAKLLLGGTFGQNDREVILHMLERPNGNIDENYRYANGHWRLIKSVIPTSSTAAQQPFTVGIKQDLNTPPALFVTGNMTRVSKELWNPNPQLTGMNLGQASVFRWKDARGYQWIAGLVKPPAYVSGQRYPLVVQTHGFQPDEFLADGSFTTGFAARPLASAGMMVLQMSDSHEHEVTLQEIPDQIRGYISAIARLNAMGLIDPQRVGIIGFSRTSYHVEGALIQDPRLFAAASIADGVDESYWQEILNYFDESSSEAEHIYGAKPVGKGLAIWIKQAPGFNLYRVQTPLMITALAQESLLGEWETYASLRMQKKPVDLLYLPQIAGYQHILQRPLERLASQQGNVDWFRFWLQGYEDPNPAKAAQYRRWEGLRKLQQADEAKTATATNP